MEIEYLCEYPQHTTQAVTWLFNQWGQDLGQTFDSITQMLLETPKCPKTLIALESQQIIAVLNFCFRKDQVWLNAFYVDELWRGRGVGKKILHRAMQDAQKIPQDILYVYTDVPLFYQKFGWSLSKYDSTTKMSVLQYNLRK